MAVIAYQTPNIPISKLSWLKATKTKGIFARHIHSLIPDIKLFAHLELKTPEGNQSLKEGSMICSGMTGKDFWQQDPHSLLNKYTIEDITPDGWSYFVPKPENTVNVHKVTQEDLDLYADPNDSPPWSYFEIDARWGHMHQPVPNGPFVYHQYGDVGDYICQNVSDSTDAWIVKKEFFDATYDLIPND